MNKEMQKSLKTGTKIGAIAGGILFIIFGIVPGFYLGSYGTVVLLSGLAGGPIEPGLLVRSAIVVGTLLGLLCTAAASIAVGSIAGTALAYVAEAATKTGRKPADETEAGSSAKA